MGATQYLARLRDLGRLYQRAVRRLDERDLRAFVLYQAERFLHPATGIPTAMDDRPITIHVEETDDFLRRLIALHRPPRSRRRNIRLLQ